MSKIALFGAGGKMGLRITDNLLKTSYSVRHVEISQTGQAALVARGVAAASAEEALADCDVVILALPDNRIGQVTDGIAHLLRPNTMLMALDIAAPMAGHLPKRDDLIVFVTHPAIRLCSVVKYCRKPSSIFSGAFTLARTSSALWCKDPKKAMRSERP